MVTHEAFLTRLDALPGSVLLTDAHSKVLYANKALELRNGFSPSEIFEKRPSDAWGHRMSNQYYKWFWQRLHSSTHVQTTIQNRHANGRLFCETLHIVPLKFDDKTFYLELQPGSVRSKAFEKDFTRSSLPSFSSFRKLFSDYFTDLPTGTTAQMFVQSLTDGMISKHAQRIEDRSVIRSQTSEKAFAELYDRYHDEILRYFLGRMATATAQECAQDVFLKAWRRFDDYRPLASYRTYLHRLAHNHFIDYLRKQRDQEASNSDLITHPKGIGQTEYRLLMDTLSGKEQELLVSHYLHGYKLREIAQRWNTTENAIKLRLSRLRKRLRKQG